jgi:hypothetical protein
MQRRLFLALLLAACAPRRKDTVSPDSCVRDPAQTVRDPADAELSKYLELSKFVVRGRVRFTGTTVANDPQGYRTYRYVIVDSDEYLKGEPFAVHPRYQRSFPLLEMVFRTEGPDEEEAAVPDNQTSIQGLACRQEEAFLFFLELPVMGSQEAIPRVPGPVERAFGRYEPRLIAIAPESARERVLALGASK